MQKAHPRRPAIRRPKIDLPIKIPITKNHRPSVIAQIQGGRGGDIGEALSGNVEEGAVAFITTEGTPLPNQLTQR